LAKHKGDGLAAHRMHWSRGQHEAPQGDGRVSWLPISGVTTSFTAPWVLMDNQPVGFFVPERVPLQPYF